MKLSVSIAEVTQMQIRRDQINRTPLKDICWYDEKGEVIKVPKKVIKDFKLTGLNNTYFILGGYYKGGEN